MNVLKKSLRYASLILSAIYLSVVFIMATTSKVPGFVAHQDKLLHGLEFTFFVILILLTLKLWNVKDEYFLAAILLIFLTLSTEFSQLFVFNRSFSALDMIADLIGGIIGFITFFIAKIIFKPLEQRFLS